MSAKSTCLHNRISCEICSLSTLSQEGKQRKITFRLMGFLFGEDESKSRTICSSRWMNWECLLKSPMFSGKTR